MKKHLESLLSIVLLLALSLTTIFAQEEFYKELKESSDLVIEGRITKSEGKWNESRTVIFTEHEVLISKVFKGEVRSKIILVTPGGIADNQFMFGSHLLDLQTGMKGVFFAQSEAFDGFSKRNTSGDSIFFAKRLGSFYPKNYTDSTIPLGYGTLKAKEDYERFLNVIGNPIYEYDEEAETVAFAFDCSDLTTETLAEVSFRNFEVSGDFESIEFDLVIQSNPEGLELGKCEYKISFPDSIFGSFLIQNSLVEISKGDLIDDNNDFQLTTTDAAADKLKIVVEHTGGIIGLEPIKLATVSMVAQDCNSVANIEWNGLTNNVNHTYFEDGEIMIYSSVSFEGGLTSPMCGCTLPSPNDPEIKSFSIDFTEEKIRAGTGEVLKIFGENFGNVIVNGSCYIEVENADHSFPVPNPGWSNANRTRIPLGDIIDWTNNEITFVVPSTTLGDISAPVESE